MHEFPNDCISARDQPRWCHVECPYYWNPTPERVRYLLIMTPKIPQLIQEIHATQERTPAIMRALFEKFDSELLA